MPKRITKTVYTFRELLAKGDTGAIDRARDWLREGQTDYNWWEYIYELWVAALDQIGFENAQIEFSGFWSQGDGASFTARVDLEKLIAFLAEPPEARETIAGNPEDFRPYIVGKCNGVRGNPKFAKLLKLVDYFDATVQRTGHHYSHENTCRFTADLRDRGEWWPPKRTQADMAIGKAPRVRAIFDDFCKAAEELRYDLCRAIYADLEDEHEYLTSDEALAETAEANEYHFTADGEREG
jgi:hypothetical protein